MRYSMAVGLALLLTTGCTASEPATVTGATAVRTAPPETAPPPEPATTQATTTAPPTTVATTDDEAAITAVVEKATRAEFETLYKDRWDPSAFDGLVTATHLKEIEEVDREKRADNLVRRPGTIFRIAVKDIQVAPDRSTATAIRCFNNNIEIWDTKGTSSVTDDILINAELGTSVVETSLVLQGENWFVNEIFESEVTLCDGLF